MLESWKGHKFSLSVVLEIPIVGRKFKPIFTRIFAVVGFLT